MTLASKVARLPAMTESYFLRPARAELVVVNPATNRPIPAEGLEVPKDAYWTRRLQQGDCVSIEREAPASEEVTE